MLSDVIAVMTHGEFLGTGLKTRPNLSDRYLLNVPIVVQGCESSTLLRTDTTAKSGMESSKMTLHLSHGYVADVDHPMDRLLLPSDIISNRMLKTCRDCKTILTHSF